MLISFVVQAEPLKVLITGAAGQIAYSLMFQVGSGSVFGPKQVHVLLFHSILNVFYR